MKMPNWPAIRILAEACQEIDEDITLDDIEASKRSDILRRAIRHLAYPDRDVYPKTRRGTKGAPIVRR